MAMRRLTTAFAAALAIGVSGAALAQTSQTHVMTVRLPDGGVAQIRYAGNVAPQVSVSDATMPVAAWAPMPSLLGADSPFAMMERISAELDRQTAAMFRQADALAAQPQSGQMTTAATNLPPGGQSYSFVSTLSGNGVCSQSVEITSQGDGAPPRIVRHSSGNCAAAPSGSGTVNMPMAPAARPDVIWTNTRPATPNAIPATPVSKPEVIWTSAKGTKPYGGLVREIPAAQR
jgi:hypothetical protein